MEVNLNDFIHIHDNSLDEYTCQFLINLFENSLDKHERVENNGCPNFTQYNLTENYNISSEVEDVHNHLIKTVFKYKKEYYEYVDQRCFPSQHNFEQFRIKKYKTDGEDYFDTHVDVTNYESSRRFLSFFWYLNDVDVGGETVFKDLTITPKQGRLVIFPPLWMFPHKGCPPISNEKYLLSTYLHYR